MMKKLMLSLVAALVIAGGVTPTAHAATPQRDAAAVRIAPTQVVQRHHRIRTIQLAAPTRYVAMKNLRVRHFEKLARGRALVAVNDGSVWIFRPCPLEDSPRCWWDAGTSGNGYGHSFVQLGRKTMYLDRILGVAQ